MVPRPAVAEAVHSNKRLEFFHGVFDSVIKLFVKFGYFLVKHAVMLGSQQHEGTFCIVELGEDICLLAIWKTQCVVQPIIERLQLLG